MQYLIKQAPVDNLSSVQSMFSIKYKNINRTTSIVETEDNTVQYELMEPFQSVKYKKPSHISYEINENNVIGYSTPFCNKCYSHKVTKHATTTRILIDDDGKAHEVKIQRYKCHKCGKYIQVEFDGRYEPYCNYSNQTKENIIRIREIISIPFRKLKEIGQILTGINMSHEQIRKSQIVTDKLSYINKEVKYSGFYSYDVQWEPLDNGFNYRHLLFDLVNNVPISEELAPDETAETTFNFINKALHNQPREAIVTDLKPGYLSIMRKLGFKHQRCIFHLRLALNERIKKYLKEKEQEITAKIKRENPNISKKQLMKLITNELKTIKNKINESKKFIFELFNQPDYNKALDFIDLLRKEFNNFPKVLKEFLSTTLFPQYQNFICFLKDEFKGKLTRTNNDSEKYFHATMPKAEKKKYRTKEGIFNQIFHRKNHWIENRKNPQTN